MYIFLKFILYSAWRRYLSCE